MRTDAPAGINLDEAMPKARRAADGKLMWIIGGVAGIFLCIVMVGMLHRINQKKATARDRTAHEIAAEPASSTREDIERDQYAKRSPVTGQATPEAVPDLLAPPIQIRYADGRTATATMTPNSPPAGTQQNTGFLNWPSQSASQNSAIIPMSNQAQSDDDKAEYDEELKRRTAPMYVSVNPGRPNMPQSQAPAIGPSPSVPSADPNQLIETEKHLLSSIHGAGTFAARQEGAAAQNGQEQKEQYIRSDRPAVSRLESPASEYMIMQGDKIPASIDGKTVSDLPGEVTATVRQDVSDHNCGQVRPDGKSHCYLLIPSGSRVIGQYNSSLTYGQSRLQLVWSRIIFPDGRSIDLGKMNAHAADGASGLRDKVDAHWKRTVSGILLSTVLTAGFQISQNRANQSPLNSYPSTGQVMAAAAGLEANRVGDQLLTKNLNVQPTVTLRQGYRFYIEANQDIPFDQPYSPAR